MNKYSTLILGLLLIVLIILAIINLMAIKKLPTEQKELNVIELKIDSIAQKKDSIKTVILNKDNEIVTNEKYFKETVNTILLQPSSVDSIFARDYIQRFIDERIR